MKNLAPADAAALEAVETREWLESLDYVLDRATRAARSGCSTRCAPARASPASACRYAATTPYINTIRRQRAGAVSRATARSSAASRAWSAGTRWRWSCAPTASRTASAATSRPTPRRRRCTRSAFNHFFRGKDAGRDADMIYFQGHASPGIYARAFLEGRFTEDAPAQLPSRAAAGAAGLSSYPHPWLMPDFWEFPTVSMGLGPLMAIYQARFARYLENRGLKRAVGPEGLGVPRRRRDGRAGSARLDLARGARKARQPDLRHQLQPAAARRSGARQRPDHPGARSRCSAAPAGT